MGAAELQREDRIKLLLVDDEEGYVDILKKRMEKRGINVATALSGHEAIQALRGQDFDVALVDFKMEDMDGIEVLKLFKKIAPEMVVIMLSGHGSEEAAREGIELGAFDYLSKPCDLNEIIKKVITACQKRGDPDG